MSRAASGTIPRPWWLSWPGLAMAAALILAWRGSGGSVAAIVGPGARAAALDFARGFWPPAHDAAFLSGLVRPLVETVAIALLGMALALAIGTPLALLATSPDVLADCGGRAGPGHRAAHAAARAVLALMRSIPEVVWALLFVRAIGLGPQAGVLALGVAYAGVVGKVFADLLESIPRGPAAALGGAGSHPWSAFAMGILPAARPLLTSYTLYRFDCALRASAVLGLVGAGGMGQQLELSLRMLRYDEVAGYVLALFAVVALVDAASHRLRGWLHGRPSVFPRPGRSLGTMVATSMAVVASLGGAAWFLRLAPWHLLERPARVGMASFARALWPPDLTPHLLLGLLPGAAQTLAISVLGTAIAASAGMVLAFVAGRPLRRLPGERPSAAWRAAGATASLSARALMNLCRTLPELLWALAFVLSVGLGPFAGALALGVHTAGVLGRLYSEALEEVSPAPTAALRALGASRLGAVLHGVGPQVFPHLVTYTLYRWEVNIRASAVLGIVGAGGLGRDLKLALSWFDYPRAATLVIAIVALVTAVDLVSAAVRRRILAGPGGAGRTRPAPRDEQALAA